MGTSEIQKEILSTSIILIADDMPGNLEVLGNMLSDAGFRIAVATNGTQACAIAAAKPPELILMDISMPGMDGYEACSKLKANPRTAGIPVVFLTAHSGEDEIVRGFEAGGVDYVTKPFKPHELLARIFTHIELRQSRERIIRQNMELQEMNDRISKSEDTLRLLNETKDRFFSILAHDLKNPVASFRQLTDVLLADDTAQDEDTRKSLIGTMHHAACNLGDLLDNILTWARAQSNRIECVPEFQSIEPVAQMAACSQKPQADQKKIAIRSELKEESAAFFDTNMVTTVFRNLISNAVKFSPPGGIITLSARETDNMLEISVSDTGIGMTEQDLDKLFRIDVSCSTIGTSREKGTGLGLILCREFVEKNGGTIRARSEPGKGSTFTFTLPCAGNESSQETL